MKKEPSSSEKSASPRRSVKKSAATAKRTMLDPQSFSPTLGEVDLYLFGEGRHEQIYEKLGAHVVSHEGVKGVSFAVWAPNAERVSVVGNFNGWDGARHPMRPLGDSGVWEIFVPKLKSG